MEKLHTTLLAYQAASRTTAEALRKKATLAATRAAVEKSLAVTDSLFAKLISWVTGNSETATRRKLSRKHESLHAHIEALNRFATNSAATKQQLEHFIVAATAFGNALDADTETLAGVTAHETGLVATLNDIGSNFEAKWAEKHRLADVQKDAQTVANTENKEARAKIRATKNLAATQLNATTTKDKNEEKAHTDKKVQAERQKAAQATYEKNYATRTRAVVGQ
jgi:hypothetical protein